MIRDLGIYIISSRRRRSALRIIVASLGKTKEEEEETAGTYTHSLEPAARVPRGRDVGRGDGAVLGGAPATSTLR